MARLIDRGKSPTEASAELVRMFPTATVEEIERALRIGRERIEMLIEEHAEAARDFANKWFSGADKSVIDGVVRQYLKDTIVKFKPCAENLFPKPNKSKS